jgi:pyrroline-5-carboxylate reductase
MNIGILGIGNMGFAIASALASTENTNIGTIQIVAHGAGDTQKKAQALSCSTRRVTPAQSIKEMKETCDVIIIAVKPQILPSLYAELATESLSHPLFISIAAGVPLATLSQKLQTTRVVRLMPNIAAKAKKSVTAVCTSDTLRAQDRATAMEIATTFGTAFPMSEALLPAFIGISGSGIAFVYQFIHAMALGGCLEGISYPQSSDIVYATIESALALAKENDTNTPPVTLEMKVCSAGGTTIEGIKTLKNDGFDSAVINAVANTAQKSRKLEKDALNK